LTRANKGAPAVTGSGGSTFSIRRSASAMTVVVVEALLSALFGSGVVVQVMVPDAPTAGGAVPRTGGRKRDRSSSQLNRGSVSFALVGGALDHAAAERAFG
jgi:hypothetical protein